MYVLHFHTSRKVTTLFYTVNEFPWTTSLLEKMTLLNSFHNYLICINKFQAESSGHTKALGKPEQKKEKVVGQTRKIFKQDVTLYERLQHLRVKESWD